MNQGEELGFKVDTVLPAEKEGKEVCETPAFDWKDWEDNKLPILADHSRAKLEILREYLINYHVIRVGALQRGVPSFKVYLIDGFAGGGKYATEDQQNEELGSPLVILQAVREAEYRVNSQRKSQIKIDAQYFFIDESKDTIASLKSVLIEQNFQHQIGKCIHLIDKPFEVAHPNICREIKKAHPRDGAKTLFFLDQCGYSKVRAQTIRQIHNLLPNSEFLVNFAITWWADFVTKPELAERLLKSTGLESEIDLADLQRQRLKEGKSDWLYTVESKVSQAFKMVAGLPYFSPFYIRPSDNHRGYWLLHLAPHYRARQAMVEVLWKKANRVRHYGKTGLEMLSYRPDEDEKNYLSGRDFDQLERTELVNRLLIELPEVIRKHESGILFRNLAASICNDTNADLPTIQDALKSLHNGNVIAIEGDKGGKKRGEILNIPENNIIRPRKQAYFNL